jgi:predicted nucleotidyltransferase
MSKTLRMDEIKNSVASVAKDYNVKTVLLFGSYANGTPTPESDIDLMVDFGKRPTSLFKIAGFKTKVENLVEKQVDIVPLPLAETSFLNISSGVLLYGI